MLAVRTVYEFIMIGAYLLIYGVLLSPVFIFKGFLQLILSSIDGYFWFINLVVRCATCSLTTAGIHGTYSALTLATSFISFAITRSIGFVSMFASFLATLASTVLGSPSESHLYSSETD